MQTTKIKLRLDGRPLRKSPGVISGAVPTEILGQLDADSPVVRRVQAIRRPQTIVAGSPRSHVSKRKRRSFNKPPPRDKGFGPIPHHHLQVQYLTENQTLEMSQLKSRCTTNFCRKRAPSPEVMIKNKNR